VEVSSRSSLCGGRVQKGSQVVHEAIEAETDREVERELPHDGRGKPRHGEAANSFRDLVNFGGTSEDGTRSPRDKRAGISGFERRQDATPPMFRSWADLTIDSGLQRSGRGVPKSRSIWP
jgi:hypothetical protein